jgi:hypothetical protein
MVLIQIDYDIFRVMALMSFGFVAMMVIWFIVFIITVFDAVKKITEQKRKRRQEIISNMCPKCLDRKSVV